MPEIWIPYGPVETLVTVQAENIASMVDPQPEPGTAEADRFADSAKDASAIFVCDSSPSTLELIRGAASRLASAAGPRLFSAAPKAVESSAPELKGRLSTLPPPIPADPGGTAYAPELLAEGRKVFVATPRPDPLFGISDAKVQACLNWVANSHVEAAGARKEMEPTPFERTASKDAMDALVERIPQASFVDAVPRGGRLRAVLTDAPFDAVRNGFLVSGVAPAKALVVGVGGRGYDDTLSSAIRAAWNSLTGVRKGGSVVMMAECAAGLGSTALEMAATGRLEASRKRGALVKGLEDIAYLARLRDDYDVLLLSGLPEVYAKSKLGLTTARGSGEAVGRVLNKIGRSGRVNMVTRAAECRIEAS